MTPSTALKHLNLFLAFGAIFAFAGCERLSELDRMELTVKCDTYARKKIPEPVGGVIKIPGVTVSSSVTTHYSFLAKRCYALEKREVINPDMGVHNYFWTLYDGLTKQQLVSTAKSIKDMNGNARGQGLEAGASAKDGEEVIERLMKSP